ncbi:MAG: hypothetical protein Q7S92_05330 [Candidatus Diapherotrites archaeon]|nr:hypothetical protein [Candidatus Diapherotrites archaeon]
MGFFDSIQDTGSLLKNTFKIIAKNPAIFKPTLAQIFLGCLFYLFVVLGLLGIFYASGAIQYFSILAFFFFLFLLLLIFPFIKMYYKAAQCWIVYTTFTGKPDTSYSAGITRARKNKKDIFLLAVFDILLNLVANKLKQGTNKGGLWIIVNIAMFFLGKLVEEGWDLVSHFLLPASIIQEKSVMQTVPELKNIKNNVTGALAGVLGIDFVGDVVRGYITSLLIVLVLLSVGIGFFFKNWILAFIIIFLVIGFNLVLKILVDMIKLVYFTLFYISVTMPLEIPEQDRVEVTKYLLHQSSANTGKPTETMDGKANKLLPYLSQYKKQGYDNEKIKSFLVKSGWPEEAIDLAFKKFKE